MTSTLETMRIKPVARIVSAPRLREGAGFMVRRAFPTAELDQLDPLLLIDEMGPADYRPGEAVGAPDHPHRGFETVTYMLDGEFEHKDSSGASGRLNPGDVQWMTAGAGVVHSETPSRRIMDEGGRVHGFQIWLNLPAAKKMSPPRYQEVPSADIPSGETPDGKAHVKVIAGEALGVCAVIDTHTPMILQDWTLKPGVELVQWVPADQNLGVYVFEGAVRLGAVATPARDGQLALLGAGDAVQFGVPDDAEAPARALLLGGAPLREPVARHGPFVMNTEQEIRQAFADYRAGRLGAITH